MKSINVTGLRVATCKGGYLFGTACGNCDRCTEELAKMSKDEVKKSEGEFIELKVEDFKKLLLCARTCKDDYFIMQNLLTMKPLEETAGDCIYRMKFRDNIFNILKTFKDFKI